MTGVRRVLRDNGLALAFGGLFLATLVGQAISGHAQFNDQQIANGAEVVSLARYVPSSSFAVDVVENWQSEMHAVGSMAIFAVYLRERGSPESKPVGAAHADTGETG